MAKRTLQTDVKELQQSVQRVEAGMRALQALKLASAAVDDGGILPVPGPRRPWLAWCKANWIGLTAVMGVLVAVVVGYITLQAWKQPQEEQRTRAELASLIDQRVDSKLAHPIELLTSYGQQLAGMDATIKQLTKQVEMLIGKGLKTSSALQTPQFLENLDAVSAQLRAATVAHVEVGQPIVSEIKDKLDAARQAQGYWEAVGAFVSYVYQQRVQPAMLQRLQMCEAGPRLTAVRDVTNLRTREHFSATGLSYLTCIVDLDTQELEDGVILDRCLVKYSGKPLKISGQVKFINCVFAITLNAPPPPQGKALTQRIFASAGNGPSAIKFGT